MQLEYRVNYFSAEKQWEITNVYYGNVLSQWPKESTQKKFDCEFFLIQKLATLNSPFKTFSWAESSFFCQCTPTLDTYGLHHYCLIGANYMGFSGRQGRLGDFFHQSLTFFGLKLNVFKEGYN